MALDAARLARARAALATALEGCSGQKVGESMQGMVDRMAEAALRHEASLEDAAAALFAETGIPRGGNTHGIWGDLGEDSQKFYRYLTGYVLQESRVDAEPSPEATSAPYP